MEHVIETGLLVSNKARRFCPEKLKVVNKSLSVMQQGYVDLLRALELIPYISCRRRIAIGVRVEIIADSMRYSCQIVTQFRSYKTAHISCMVKLYSLW